MFRVCVFVLAAVVALGVTFASSSTDIPFPLVAAMTAAVVEEETLLIGYSAVVKFLNARGFPIKQATLNKLCAPSAGLGPCPVAFWGARPAFKPAEVLGWA